jgi:pre-mRNA-splicing factor CWC22
MGTVVWRNSGYDRDGSHDARDDGRRGRRRDTDGDEGYNSHRNERRIDRIREEEEEYRARTERKRDRDRRREDHRSDRKDEDAYAYERKKRDRSGGEEDGSTALQSNVQIGHARTVPLLLNPKPGIEEEEAEDARTDRKRLRSGRREEEEEDSQKKRERNGGGESRHRGKRREEEEGAWMDRKRERDGGGKRHRSEIDYSRMDQSKATVQELAKDEPAVDVRRVETADGVIRSERLVEGAIGERAAEKPIEQVAGRSGGVYVPPFKLAQMMRDVKDKSSAQYQRMTWDALRKSINGLVNKVNSSNIKNILPELFGENLIRGRGLFARSCMKSQMASPAFTHVFAALVAVVNTKFPELGELLLKRIILQLRRAFKRNDKVCPSTLVHRFSRKICM